MIAYTKQSLQSRLHHRYQHAPVDRALAFYARNREVSWHNLGELYESAAARARAPYDLWLLSGAVCILISDNDELISTNLLALLVLSVIMVLSVTPVLRGHHAKLKDVLKHLIRKTQASMVLAGKPLEPLRVRLETLKTNNFGMTKNVGAPFSDAKEILVVYHLDSDMLFKREIAGSVSLQLGGKAIEAILLSEEMMMTKTFNDNMRRHRYYRELYMNDALQAVAQSRW